VTTATLTRLAMIVAGLMLAHQFAAKAFRDAAFLSAWSPAALPPMVIATVVLLLAAVPVYARLLAAFGPHRVVPIGFLLSSLGHLVEWRLSSGHPWVAAAIYLHIAGLGTLLLSGFWTLVSERFDPRGAKAGFGRIAAAGTLGGLAGGLAAAAFATTPDPSQTLMFLAVMHAACALGVFLLGRAAETFPADSPEPATASGLFRLDVLRASPHLRAVALLVVLSTASAFLVDYLLKAEVAVRFATEAAKLQFFAWFYTAVGVVTFLAQASVGYTVRQAGIGRTISSLPIGLGSMSLAAVIFKAAFPLIVVARGVEAVVRGSLFRSGYELLFVPMAPAEKRRAKTFLDVTCDRAGDAFGAAIVQLLLLTGTMFLASELLAIVMVMAIGGFLITRRLDRMYLSVVERQLVRHVDVSPVIVGSETGWTVIDVAPADPTAAVTVATTAALAPRREDDPKIRVLVELRSGDRRRVEGALARLSAPDRLHIAQIIRLLAWDDVVGSARAVLERVAPSHVGLLVDELLDADTDFAIRRRLPRILGTVPTPRAVDGLVRGLDDVRFEVRYQCSRALDRLLMKGTALAVDDGQVLAVVERELSVPAPIWQGHRLIDEPESDHSPTGSTGDAARAQRNLEHVFSLLATVLPREPLQVAFRGIRSEHDGLRGLAIEYLESVLPPAIQQRLWALLNASVESGGVRTSPEQALQKLRLSQEQRAVTDEES
jgi:ATP:ADP antiporter, AAA family